MTKHKLEKKKKREKRVTKVAKGSFRPVRAEDVKVQITDKDGKQQRVPLPEVLEFLTQNFVALRNEFKEYANKVDDFEAWGDFEEHDATPAEEAGSESETESLLILPDKAEEEGS